MLLTHMLFYMQSLKEEKMHLPPLTSITQIALISENSC